MRYRYSTYFNWFEKGSTEAIKFLIITIDYLINLGFIVDEVHHNLLGTSQSQKSKLLLGIYNYIPVAIIIYFYVIMV
jgi:hypothetical protein